MFYGAVDKYRKEVLAKEYSMRGEMDELEVEMTRMLAICKNMSMIEFFSNRDSLHKQM